MKHLKLFENFTSKYSIGDYVLLSKGKWRVHTVVYIYDVYFNDDENKYNYHVEGKFIDNNEKTVFWIEDSEIEKKLTTKEVEDFLLKIDAEKYNL